MSIPSVGSVTPQGSSISNLFVVSLVLSGLVFALVAGLLLTFIFRFRRQGDDDADGPSGNRRLEIFWTATPLLLLTVLFVFTVRTMNRVTEAEPAGTALEITVTGRQWWWEFAYPGSNVVTANELHVPTGRPLHIVVRSTDVIHSFWVPEFGWKMDAIPTKDNSMWLEVRDPGVYDGACAEFCGTQHAWMRISVVAEPPEQFDAWLRSQQAVPPAPADDLARRGQQVLLSQTCGSCHTIAGTDADGTVGPNLTHVGSRETLGAGVVDNTPEHLAEWIRDAHAIKPGVLMPPYTLPTDDLNALVAYLEGLR